MPSERAAAAAALVAAAVDSSPALRRASLARLTLVSYHCTLIQHSAIAYTTILQRSTT